MEKIVPVVDENQFGNYDVVVKVRQNYAYHNNYEPGDQQYRIPADDSVDAVRKITASLHIILLPGQVLIIEAKRGNY